MAKGRSAPRWIMPFVATPNSVASSSRGSGGGGCCLLGPGEVRSRSRAGLERRGPAASCPGDGVAGRRQRVEGPCYILEGRQTLQSALWDLDRLLRGWVTPKLAVGPSARRRSYRTRPRLRKNSGRSRPCLRCQRSGSRMSRDSGRCSGRSGNPDQAEVPPRSSFVGATENVRTYPDPPHADPHRTRFPGVRGDLRLAVR